MATYVKQNGVWVEATPSAKHNNTFKEPVSIHAKHNGVWEKVWEPSSGLRVPQPPYRWVFATNSTTRNRVQGISNSGNVLYNGMAYNIDGGMTYATAGDIMDFGGFSESSDGLRKGGIKTTREALFYDYTTMMDDTGRSMVGGDNAEKGFYSTTIDTTNDHMGGDSSTSRDWTWWLDVSANYIYMPTWYLYDDGKNPPTWTSSTYSMSDTYWAASSGRFLTYLYIVGSPTVTRRLYVKDGIDGNARAFVIAGGGTSHKFNSAPRCYVSEDGLTVLFAEWPTTTSYQIQRFTRPNLDGNFTLANVCTFDGATTITHGVTSYLCAQWAVSNDLKTFVGQIAGNKLAVYRDEAGNGTYTKVHDLTPPVKTHFDSRAIKAYFKTNATGGRSIQISADGSHVVAPWSSYYEHMPDGKTLTKVWQHGYVCYGI